MPPGFWMRVGALSGGLAVLLGAFGAHGLQESLEARDAVAIWDKAVLYHLIHSLMLCLLDARMPSFRGPAWAFVTGILLFSGSLYGLALKDIAWMGPITPLGGLSFLVGWAWLAIATPAHLGDNSAADPSGTSLEDREAHK